MQHLEFECHLNDWPPLISTCMRLVFTLFYTGFHSQVAWNILQEHGNLDSISLMKFRVPSDVKHGDFVRFICVNDSLFFREEREKGMFESSGR